MYWFTKSQKEHFCNLGNRKNENSGGTIDRGSCVFRYDIDLIPKCV